MSAIVAKAINGTIGTSDFRGVDEIFEGILSRVTDLTNRVYSYRDGDAPILTLEFLVDEGMTVNSRRVLFEYGGVLLAKYPDKLGIEYSIKGSGIISSNNGGFFTIQDGAEIYFSVKNSGTESGTQRVSICLCGHTEYAPSHSFSVK